MPTLDSETTNNLNKLSNLLLKFSGDAEKDSQTEHHVTKTQGHGRAGLADPVTAEPMP